MRGIGAAIAGTLAVLAALGLLIVGSLWLRSELAAPTGAVQAKEQTVGSGAYRISAYDRFYDDCSAAKTTQQNLDTAKDAAATGPHKADPTRQAQLDANVTALTNELNSQVNSYNADAAKTATRGQFRSSDLPFTLDAKTEIRCTA